VKFLVDAQLPPALANLLRAAGHTAQHVSELDLREAGDSVIWRYALDRQAVIVTKDEDFAARARQSRRSPTVVWLRIGNCSSQALVRWFVPLLPGIVREVVQGHRLIQVR